jgi:hypothetical protein
VAPGGTLTLTGDGFPPNTPFTATLHSTPVNLGGGTTDLNGHFEFAATIPSNIEPGQHMITVATADGHSASVDLAVTTPTTVAANTATTSATAGAVAATPTPSSLAFTGLDGRAWLTIAGGCLLSGFVMLYGKPRTAPSHARRR